MLAQLGQWILNRIIISGLNWVAQYLPAMLLDWKHKKEREIAQADAAKEYEKAAKNKELTAQEKADAYEKFRNSGK